MHNSVLNHIAVCLKSALVGKSTVKLYCDLDGLQAPGGRSIPADVMVQAQRPDLVIIDRSVHGRHRIALVKLTCPWDTDAKRAEEHKTARYADLKISLSNEGWDCSLYLIEVGARGHIIKSVKDRLRLSFLAWVPAVANRKSRSCRQKVQWPPEFFQRIILLTIYNLWVTMWMSKVEAHRCCS
jgi:hypothetical protein